MSRILFATVIACALLAASCNDTITVAAPSSSPTRIAEFYTGTIGTGESQFYSFGVLTTGSTEVTLVSLRPAGSTTATLSTVMGIGIGTPAGTDCTVASTTTTAPGLSAQLTMSTSATTYCVKIADIGNVRSPEDFALRILHP